MVRVFVCKINVVRPVCDSLVGEHHTFTHRAIAGVIIMACGVSIAKYFGHSEDHLVAAVGDMIGYAIHGIGLIPFAEEILHRGES